MHVWLLTSEFPPTVAGGIATYADTFSRLLGKHGHQVTVIAESNRTRETTPAPGVTLIEFCPPADSSDIDSADLTEEHPAFPYNVLAHRPAVSQEVAALVLRLCDERGAPDVIESQEYLALPYYLIQRKLTERTALGRTPVVVQLHSPDYEIARLNQEARYRFPRYWVGQMEKFSIVAADAVVSPSQFLADRTEEILQRRLNIACIPYPIPPSTLDAQGAPHPQRVEIVYVGRLEVRKGVLPFVRECGRLWAAGHSFQVTLVGGVNPLAPRRTTVGDFIQREYGHWIDTGFLRLTGPVDRAQARQYLRDAWAVVIPSVWDNFPNVCIEAMASSQVVLASNRGGQAEMLTPQGGIKPGILFDWDVPGDFEQRFIELLALSDDDRLVMGATAKSRIHTLCDPDTILRARVQHYEATIAGVRERDTFPTLDPRMPSANRRNGSAPRPSDDLLSVIIPIAPESGPVQATQASVRNTSYAPVETLLIHYGRGRTAAVDHGRSTETGSNSSRVLSVESGELSVACAAGIDGAHGEFLTFLEPEGSIHADYYARAIEVLRRYPNVSCVYPWVRRFGDHDAIWPTWNSELPYLLGQPRVPVSTVLRREALSDRMREMPELQCGVEDLETWLGLTLRDRVGVSLPFPLARARTSADDSARTADVNGLLYLSDLVPQSGRAEGQKWSSELMNLLQANGPSYLWRHPATTADGGAVATRLRESACRLTEAVDGLERTPARSHGDLDELKACRDDLIRAVADVPPWRLAGPGDWYDQELGRRFVKLVRRSRFGGYVLSSHRLRKAIKQLLFLS